MYGIDYFSLIFIVNIYKFFNVLKKKNFGKIVYKNKKLFFINIFDDIL